MKKLASLLTINGLVPTYAYNHMKYFLPYLSRFWLRPLFTPNMRGGFRVLKPKSCDLLLPNLIQTYNQYLNCKILHEGTLF